MPETDTRELGYSLYKMAPMKEGEASVAVAVEGEAAVAVVEAPVDMTTHLARFNTMLLNKHNQYRALHGVPPMVYDEEVAKSAQSWSEKM